MGRTAEIRCRQADHQKRVACRLGGLGKGLGKGEMRFKTSARKIALVVELTRIRHPFIDQNQAGTVFVEKNTQHISGAGGFFIIRTDSLVGFFSAELPGQLSPEGIHHCSVRLFNRVSRGNLISDQHHTVCLGDRSDVYFL